MTETTKPSDKLASEPTAVGLAHIVKELNTPSASGRINPEHDILEDFTSRFHAQVTSPESHIRFYKGFWVFQEHTLRVEITVGPAVACNPGYLVETWIKNECRWSTVAEVRGPIKDTKPRGAEDWFLNILVEALTVSHHILR